MNNDEQIAVLGENTTYNGNLTFDKNLKIRGKYYGTILSGGTLFLEGSAYFEGNINVEISIIAGHVLGDVTAEKKIDVLADSVVIGNLKAPIIKIADGVKIEGKCQMIQDSDSVDIFSTSVNQLKKSVVIV